jgi:hypothetical protein
MFEILTPVYLSSPEAEVARTGKRTKFIESVIAVHEVPEIFK